MYSPKIQEDQVRKLHELAERQKKPMTQLVREAIDRYLDEADDLQDEGDH